ncbi:MAG: pantothenate kinase [archaeon]|nr:pantothenate kinase [archaeon]
MVTAFCPGHITCFFRPAGEPGEPTLSRGSLGAGIRTSLGATVTVTERSDSILRIVMDGQETPASVTESVFKQLAPGRGFDVIIENGLPCGEGFGMSAAGAIAASLCLADILGLSEQRAYEVAHIAEIEGGGGLGDVSAIYCLAHQPVRVRQGLPPAGEVKGFPIEFPKLTLAVLGPKMHTGNVLGTPEKYNAIVAAGGEAVSDYLEGPTEDRLYSLSNSFSRKAGVECRTVSEALDVLHGDGYRAAMCMLGNSIFCDADPGTVRRLLGQSVQVFECSSTDEPAGLIRTV